MRLEPVDAPRIPEAVALLARGFPARGEAWWRESLERLEAWRARTEARPIAQLGMADGRAVGVILTIASRREEGAVSRDVVNLSSWYVEPRYRWLAPLMLARVTADGSVTYTDLSPTRETIRINERLGFRTVARGFLLVFLLWAALMGRAAGRVVPFEDLPLEAVGAGDRAVMGHHRDLGSIAAALQVGDQYHPLLFHPVRKKGLPVAQLVLAPSRELVARHIVPIARFLLRRGMLFLALFGEGAETTTGGILWNRDASVQVKGWGGDRVDHTYSEVVFLRM